MSARSESNDAPDADSGSDPIRIVLADDHAVVRSGLRMLLDSEPDFEVVAEASDVDSARRYVRGHHPAVLVLDLNMPGGSSLEAIPVIREESPDTQIVVLTMQQEPAFARAGARRGRARLRAQGGRRRRARRGGAPRRRGRELPEPAGSAPARRRAAARARPTTSPSERSRCCG